MACECDHLTDFALVADVMADPAAFFGAIMQLELNVPIPLSLSELLTKLSALTAGHYIGMCMLFLLMALGLRLAVYVSIPSLSSSLRQ